MKNQQIHDLQTRFSHHLVSIEQKEEGIALQHIDHLEEMASRGSSLCCSLYAASIILPFFVDRCEFFSPREGWKEMMINKGGKVNMHCNRECNRH